MFTPIVAGPICKGVTCLPFALIPIAYYLPYVLAVLFSVAAIVSWWKLRWNRITILLLTFALLSVATLVPRYWSMYMQKMTAEQNAKLKKEQAAAIVKAANFQLYQPSQTLRGLNLITFYPDKVNMLVESGGGVQRPQFRIVYENTSKVRLIIYYESSQESPEKNGWGCSKSGEPLQKSRSAQTCQKVSVLSDGATVYRQDYDLDSDRYIYSAVRKDTSFVTGATAMKPDVVSTALDGFFTADRDAIKLVEAQ